MNNTETIFTSTPLEVEGWTFWFDGNGKVTAGNGTFDSPRPNAFSLLHIDDCPGSTPICQESCYVNNLEKTQPELYARYAMNSKNLREVLGSLGKATIVAEAFAKWVQENASAGFRWHVSGDVISDHYALFIRKVCKLAYMVDFWIYTRTFDAVSILCEANNLTVNLSADEDNYERARLVHKLTGARICYMTVGGEVPNDLPDGSVIMPSYGLRGQDSQWWEGLNQKQKKMVCPPDFFGQSEKMRCGVCRKCLDQG